MHIFPLSTPLLHPNDDLVSALLKAIKKSPAASLQPGDILTISSKAVATCESAQIDLTKIHPGNDADDYAKTSGRSAAFCQAVLDECARLHGDVRGTCPGAILTELHPDGMDGSLLIPNAGLDESNTQYGTAIGWPCDPVCSIQALRSAFHNKQDLRLQTWDLGTNHDSKSHVSGLTSHVSILLTDSCVIPRRWGVIAFALAVCGLDPLRNEKGKQDLFGRDIRITTEAVGDQLAIMGNAVMGNVAQSCPAALIRDHNVPMSDFCGWVPGIAPEDDLFHGLI